MYVNALVAHQVVQVVADLLQAVVVAAVVLDLHQVVPHRHPVHHHHPDVESQHVVEPESEVQDQ